MPLPWFRFYHEWIHDPKVQNLSFEWQRHFVAILCWHAEGTLQSLPDEIIAESFRMSIEELGVMKKSFTMRGFIEDGWTPKNWNKRQPKSDSSYERVKKHREKAKTSARVERACNDNDVTACNADDNGMITGETVSVSYSSILNGNASIEEKSKSDNVTVALRNASDNVTKRDDNVSPPSYPDPMTAFSIIHTGPHDIEDSVARDIWSRAWAAWKDESICYGFYEHQRFYSAEAWIEAFATVKKKYGDRRISIGLVEKIAADVNAHGAKKAKPYAPDPKPRAEKPSEPLPPYYTASKDVDELYKREKGSKP